MCTSGHRAHINVLPQKLKETAKGLELRPEHFEDDLVGLGFSAAHHLGSSGQAGSWHLCAHGFTELTSCSGFDRPIDLYVK
jgi:hypothetical protein